MSEADSAALLERFASPIDLHEESVREYSTVALSEKHFIGVDRKPLYSDQSQTLISQVERLRFIRITCDSESLASLEIQQGGEVVARDPNVVAPDFVDHVVKLAADVQEGEFRLLRYRTNFDYSSVALPTPQMRRGARPGSGLDEFSMSVHFAEGVVPAAVFWSTWDTLESDPRDLARLHLSNNEIAEHRSRPAGLFGFRWEW